MGRPRKPVCGRLLRPYTLNRPREDGASLQVCGLPAGHLRNCVSAESVERTRKVRDLNRKARRALYGYQAN